MILICEYVLSLEDFNIVEDGLMGGVSVEGWFYGGGSTIDLVVAVILKLEHELCI